MFVLHISFAAWCFGIWGFSRRPAMIWAVYIFPFRACHINRTKSHCNETWTRISRKYCPSISGCNNISMVRSCLVWSSRSSGLYWISSTSQGFIYLLKVSKRSLQKWQKTRNCFWVEDNYDIRLEYCTNCLNSHHYSLCTFVSQPSQLLPVSSMKVTPPDDDERNQNSIAALVESMHSVCEANPVINGMCWNFISLCRCVGFMAQLL